MYTYKPLTSKQRLVIGLIYLAILIGRTLFLWVSNLVSNPFAEWLDFRFSDTTAGLIYLAFCLIWGTILMTTLQFDVKLVFSRMTKGSAWGTRILVFIFGLLSVLLGNHVRKMEPSTGNWMIFVGFSLCLSGVGGYWFDPRRKS